MHRLTISQYLQRSDAYPVSPATVRRYIDQGILPGEKVKAGRKVTYYVHIQPQQDDNNLINQMARG